MPQNKIVMNFHAFYLLVLLCVLLCEAPLHAEDSHSGFISMDCGIPKGSNYTEPRNGITYISDEGFIDTGETYVNVTERPYVYVRSFPEGKRNCYILKPAFGKSNKYLIRATFLYGNYDGKDILPEFDLHFGVDYWYTVNITDGLLKDQPEIVLFPSSDTIYLCLVNTGKGTPFISTLELRPLNNSMYPTASGSLSLFARLDFGNNGFQTVRYKDDIYDRIWLPLVFEKTQTTINTTSIVNYTTANFFKPPSNVMNTASAPLDPTLPLTFTWSTDRVTEKPYVNVRSFPEGKRNCYILKPALGKSNKYLIRAIFLYGNYDGKDKLPEFDLHFGVDYWHTMNITDGSLKHQSEIVHVPSSDTIYLCLVNTGKGTPFISSLELRPLENSMYHTSSGSLCLFVRLDLSNNGFQTVRYKDDIYDRIWSPVVFEDTQTTINTTLIVNPTPANFFKPPSNIMNTASTPLDPTLPLTFNWPTNSATDRYHIYLYFAELEKLQPNQTREFNIYLNGELYFNQPISPSYLISKTLYSNLSETGYSSYSLSLNKTKKSTLPPILNALEVYKVIDIQHTQTGDLETAAMYSIKSTYRISRNWQGDPCAPREYVWDGVNCNYNGFDAPKLVSLNLSSSGISGYILAIIVNLSNLETLDLSNNNLTGQIPDFLGNLLSLKVLNIKGNNFTGQIPSQLLNKWRDGDLLLSVDGLPNNEVVKRKKSNVLLPIVASISALLVFLILLAILWIVRRKQRESRKKSKSNAYSLETKNKQFTYLEILSITNNLETIIGRGGFGIVYHGKIDDNEVAVKMFSSASFDEGFKELVSEFNVLINVHHKNLTALVGYCIDGEHVGIIYEFMANGDLKGQLAEKNLYVLNWKDRLQIALDAAQGLEYLHHGIQKAIVHRDIKCTNILLDVKFQAKIGDFGLSIAYPVETVSHISTNKIAGTPGYLDPEYQNTGRLTEKSDVYSFGIVIMEIITGKPAIMSNNPNPPINLTNWVRWIMRQGDVKGIVDPRLMGEFEVSSAKKAVEIAMDCVSQESADRPTMTRVVTVLKDCLGMEMIPQEKREKIQMDSNGQIYVPSESMAMLR